MVAQYLLCFLIKTIDTWGYTIDLNSIRYVHVRGVLRYCKRDDDLDSREKSRGVE